MYPVRGKDFPNSADLQKANRTSKGMYLAVDVGATKTELALFSKDGQVTYRQKIKTNHNYDHFLKSLQQILQQNEFRSAKISHCCGAFPGWLNLKSGVAIAFGVLPWRNVTVRQDLQTIMPGVKVLIQNDAKLAALSEANLSHKKYRKILYITLSTGIGGGVIIDGVIDPDFETFEPGQMEFDFEGKNQKWEDIASGKALVSRYGKRAEDLEDPETWKEYAHLVAMGFQELLPTIQPDLIIIGGGAGAHLEKFQKFLVAELEKINNPLVPLPPIIKAKRPEEAVIYGCYEYIRQLRRPG